MDEQKQNRREFMRNSSIAVGGAMLSTLPIDASAYGDGDDIIRVGLIGCGGRGTGAAVQALSTKQNVKLVAMADAFRDRLDSSYSNIKSELDNNEVDPTRLAVAEDQKFVGFDAYQKVIPVVDVVILTTPPGFRPMCFEAAVNANKHVFTEKPMAVDAPGVRKVLEVAQRAKEKKLNVVVGLQRHYQTVYRNWIDQIHQGAIGDITSGNVYWNSAGVWVRERQPGQTEMEYQMRNWYYFNWLCGDHITEQHIHNLDVGNWVKQGYPVSAQGMGGREVRVGPDYGQIFDHHFVELEYQDGSKIFSQCRHIKGCLHRVTEGFMGTNGSAPKPGLLLNKNGNVVMDHDDKNDPNPYQVEHDELFAAIAKGEYKYADAENGANSTMTSILGRMATYSGQLVKWDEAINSGISLMPPKLAWDANPLILPGENGLYPAAIPGVTKAV